MRRRTAASSALAGDAAPRSARNTPARRSVAPQPPPAGGESGGVADSDAGVKRSGGAPGGANSARASPSAALCACIRPARSDSASVVNSNAAALPASAGST
jgi:hypothetical protein